MANNRVHTGYWVDHSRGSVLGATITLETKWGSHLVAAAAIVVQITGVALWTILAFLLHRYLSGTDLKDEFDAQLQVLLRNASGAETSMFNFLALGKSWKGRRAKVWRKAASIAALSGFVYVGFIVAGVFVGEIATNSYDATNVLRKEGLCGFLASTDTLGVDLFATNISAASRQYAQSCYTDLSDDAFSCSVYPVKMLGYNISTDQPCPFSDGACFEEPDGPPITLKTGSLDSHDQFGINAPKSDRLNFEYQTTCAPLRYDFVDKHTTMRWNMSFDGKEDFPLQEYQLATNSNGTPVYEYYSIFQTLGTSAVSGILLYSVFPWQIIHSDAPDPGDYVPVTALLGSPGDPTLLFVAPNGVHYRSPTQDPMFRTVTSPSSLDPHFPYQICNPVKDLCTDWQGVRALQGEQESWRTRLQLNNNQNATFTRLAAFPNFASIYASVNGAPNPLIASTYIALNSGSKPLPDGIWKREVELWFQTALASMQYSQSIIVDLPADALGRDDLTFKAQCSQQRVTAPAQYTSYNLFGLVLVAVVGFIVCSAAVALKVAYQFRLGVNLRDPHYLSYVAEGLLQLHRMALEGAGYGGWKGTTTDIPYVETPEERVPPATLIGHGDEDDGGDVTLRYPRPEEVSSSDRLLDSGESNSSQAEK